MNILLALFSFITMRATEPSTHAGLAGIILAIKPFIPPVYVPLLDPIAALFAAGAVLLREKSTTATK